MAFAASAVLRAARGPLRIGLIGHGAIGGHVAKSLLDGTLPDARLAAVLVKHQRSPPPELAFAGGPLFTADAEAFFRADWDVAVEAAGQPLVREHACRILGDLRRDFLMTSIGTLCDDAFHEKLVSVAKDSGTRLLIAAGALPGMDWMSSAALENLERVSITQTKQPSGWAGTPAEDSVDLHSLTEAATVYEGTAREAATLFPKNANISAALALATVGLDSVQVRLVADPAAPGPLVRVELQGAAGELSIDVRGRPAFGSQRTSMIVPLSVVKAIRNLSSHKFLGV
mmetsp:Transcript_117870/g.227298  ORF Transcript_117870/g.227298 Transcript_117870/m.227298 type:complete len:286 (-) Transcript_117870:87-944(-)